MVQTYDVTVDDKHGGTAIQTITITLTGTNHAPVITGGTTSGAITELPIVSAVADTATGSLAFTEVDQPDILMVEGVNVLQTAPLPHHGKAVPVVSDFFDFSIYIDADEAVMREWYVQRFLTFRNTAFHDPRSYFHRYSLLSDDEATATATAIWERTNLANLEENILPTRPRATLILTKGADHLIETVALRRL